MSLELNRGQTRCEPTLEGTSLITPAFPSGRDFRTGFYESRGLCYKVYYKTNILVSVCGCSFFRALESYPGCYTR